MERQGDAQQHDICSYEAIFRRLLRRIGTQWCKRVAISRAGYEQSDCITKLLDVSELQAILPELRHVEPLAALVERSSFEASIAELRSNLHMEVAHLQNCVDFVLVRCPIIDKSQLGERMKWPVDSRWGILGRTIDGLKILQLVEEESLTLVLTRADFRIARLASFIDRVSGVAHRLANSTLYWTPATPSLFNCGFQPHEDDHCVVIVQLQGVKHWILWPSWGMRCRRFLRKARGKPRNLHVNKDSRRWKNKALNASMRPFGRPLKHITLKPGDLLYLPQGIPHAAWSSHGSLHLTVGLEDEFLFSWEGCVHVMIAQSCRHEKSVSNATCQRAMHQLVVSAAKFGSLRLRRLLKLPIMLAAEEGTMTIQADIIRSELEVYLVVEPVQGVSCSVVDIIVEMLECVPQTSKQVESNLKKNIHPRELTPVNMLLRLLTLPCLIEESLDALKETLREQQDFRRKVRNAYLTRERMRSLTLRKPREGELCLGRS